MPLEQPTTPIIRVVRKATTETVNNSAALQNDNELKFAMGANDVWAFQLYLRYDSSAVADIQMDISVPAGASVDGVAVGRNSAGTMISIEVGLTSALNLGGQGAGTTVRAEITGVVINGGTAGDFQLRWAQLAAEVSDTKVLSDSYLIAHKLP